MIFFTTKVLKHAVTALFSCECYLLNYHNSCNFVPIEKIEYRAEIKYSFLRKKKEEKKGMMCLVKFMVTLQAVQIRLPLQEWLKYPLYWTLILNWTSAEYFAAYFKNSVMYEKAFCQIGAAVIYKWQIQKKKHVKTKSGWFLAPAQNCWENTDSSQLIRDQKTVQTVSFLRLISS